MGSFDYSPPPAALDYTMAVSFVCPHCEGALHENQPVAGVEIAYWTQPDDGMWIEARPTCPVTNKQVTLSLDVQ